MVNGKDFNKGGENVDDFYKKKTFHPEDFDGEDVNYDHNKDDTEVDYEELEYKWYGIEDEYRRRYTDLTDEDVNVEPNRFRQTVERIARRRGRTFQDVLDEIEKW